MHQQTALAPSRKFKPLRTHLETIDKNIRQVRSNPNPNVPFIEKAIPEDSAQCPVSTDFKFEFNLSDVECGALDVEGTHGAASPRLVCLAIRLHDKPTSIQTICFQTAEDVHKSFMTLKEFLCPKDSKQITTLHTHGGDENEFLSHCKLSAINLQHQDEDTLKSLCGACANVMGTKCQKNKEAIEHWIHDEFTSLPHPAFNQLGSLQNSTVVHMCVANVVAILTLAENSLTTSKRSQMPLTATLFDSQPIGSVDSSDLV